ncbi:MAG: FapA family protein, partial [Desulfobacula sp.]|nr:FapA family protein [Desulfobacula sp.]
SLLEHKGIRPAPDVFENEFVFICKIIKDLFDQVTTRCHSDPVTLNLGKILNKDKHPEDTTDTDKDAIEQPENDQTDSKEPNGEEPDSKKNLPEDEPILPELMEKILKQAFTRTINTWVQTLSKSPEPDDIVTDMTDNILEEYFEILISEDQTKAYIKKIKDLDSNCPQIDLSDLLGLLGQKQISYGILDNEAIEIWISKSFTQKIIIAKGEEAVHGRDGEIKFHFETNFTNPGKISEDGSIDFRERGEIPYIHKEDLLAVKTPPRQGKSGISVSGVPIPVDEVIDPVFIAGPGTEMTEDGFSIHAAIDGQPHLDALGTISVNPDLVIPGDVDFETGNIDFSGNIIVKGMIKEGFTVKGINLTAQEIEGGIIDLTGDLNVSAGITGSTISAHGNVYAKFINHSNIMGFGNLTISKEIIDSDIILSGSCSNQTGHIISSQITAKLGIEAGKIGTASSKPVNLKLGVNEHIEMLKKRIDQVLEACVSKTSLLKDEIKKLEDHDQALYQQISEKAHIQDRSQIEIKELKKSLPGLEKSNDLVKVQQISNEIKKLIAAAKDAEKQLNTIFETQDKIANETAQFKDQIKVLEDQTKNHVIEKKALKEFSKKDKPLPVVTVAKTITQDSIIKGPHSSIILKEDASRCKIQELASQGESLQFYEMNISDL